jgi:hypothetical protein
VIPGMSIKFGDVCRFKRRLYAVDKTGRTVAVGPDDPTVQLVAESLVGGGVAKFLVESKGDLLLVDVYNCERIDFPGHNPVRIHLFKLNEKESEWVKLKSLGDIILFLGADCSFSASASDLSVAKGNCVIFLENVFQSIQHFGYVHCPTGLTWTTTGCVLDLDNHRLSPFCPIIRNISTCSRSLQSGSSKAAIVTEYVILHLI